MRDIQEKLLGSIVIAAQAGGTGYDEDNDRVCKVEVVQRPQYANDGHLYVQLTGRYNTLLTVGYSFQTTYCAFDLSGPAGTRQFHYIKYEAHTEIEEVLATVRRFVAEGLAKHEAPVLTDEPGKITKLTGPRSVSHPGD